jgi:hypothetical protein
MKPPSSNQIPRRKASCRDSVMLIVRAQRVHQSKKKANTTFISYLDEDEAKVERAVNSVKFLAHKVGTIIPR